MPVICRKNFSITVAPGYYAYFKCDEATGAAALVNSVDGKNLVLSSGTTASLPGKIGTSIELADSVTRAWVTATEAHWALTGSFTVRFWINPVYRPGNYAILFIINQFTLWLIADLWAPGKIYTEWIVNDDDGGSVSVDNPTELTLGSWNHVMLWFENGVGAGVKINNGAATTSPDTFPVRSFATRYMTLTGSHFMWSNAFDELAIWNRKLTTAEMTADWNSGNGVTYP